MTFRGAKEGQMVVDQVIRDVALVRVALVDWLPPACGGGIAVTQPDGMIWVLVEGTQPDTMIEGVIDLGVWTDVGYNLIARGEPVTVADQAARFDQPLEVARAAFWAFAWEWWLRTQFADRAA